MSLLGSAQNFGETQRKNFGFSDHRYDAGTDLFRESDRLINHCNGLHNQRVVQTNNVGTFRHANGVLLAEKRVVVGKQRSGAIPARSDVKKVQCVSLLWKDGELELTAAAVARSRSLGWTASTNLPMNRFRERPASNGKFPHRSCGTHIKLRISSGYVEDKWLSWCWLLLQNLEEIELLQKGQVLWCVLYFAGMSHDVRKVAVGKRHETLTTDKNQ